MDHQVSMNETNQKQRVIGHEFYYGGKAVGKLNWGCGNPPPHDLKGQIPSLYHPHSHLFMLLLLFMYHFDPPFFH